MNILDQHMAVFLVIALIVAVVALLFAAFLSIRLSRFRRDQQVILGENREPRDLVTHGRAVQEKVEALSSELRQLTLGLDSTDQRVDQCLIFRSVIRYDAYRDLSGMQSSSVALLDTKFSGVIISAIQSREHARIYVKEVRHGESTEKLSPEEIHVLKEAMGLKSQAPVSAIGAGPLG